MNACLRRWVLAGGVVWAGLTGAASPPPLEDVAEVALGLEFSCALNRQGEALCWGSNEYGELGTSEGAATARTTPVPVASAGSDLHGLVAGGFHACAITAAGGVKCWGRDLNGALGDGPENGGPAAVSVVGLDSGVRALAAGAAHGCAVLTSGAVKCWGYNIRGQLGDGTMVEERSSPVDVIGLGGAAIAIEASGAVTCAILTDGSVKCWGENDYGQLGDTTTMHRAQPVQVQGLPGAVSSIAVTPRATCAISTDSAVHCWGAEYPLAAFEGGRLFANPYPGFGGPYVQIDGGKFFFCALSQAGAIKCFGDGLNGQFGTGPIDGSLGAETAIGLAPGIVQVATGGDHTCARSSAGGLQCWGLNTRGQLGLDSITRRLVPTQVTGLTSGIGSVSAGEGTSCSLSTTGAVKCWGSNNQDNVGDDTRLQRTTPVDVVGLQSGVRAIASGGEFNCAVLTAGGVKCWGANYDGRLGNGQTLNSGVPVDVVGLGSPAVTQISLGNAHGCALLQGGAVKCWGTNEYGQLGDGSNERRLGAVDAVGLGSGVSVISAGYYHTCAVAAGGALKCWGVNENGQLGDASTTSRNVPTAVTGLGSGVQSVDAGVRHTCAVVAGGAVQCWGDSFYGNALGDGSEVSRSVPGEVPALREGVVEVSLGFGMSCARLAVGEVKCWGAGVPIGDNTENYRPFPTDVVGLDGGATDLDISFDGHSCVVIGGAAKCWGSNGGGQIGDGTTHGVPLPQYVLSDQFERRVDAVTTAANGPSTTSRSDASGRYVVFQSSASNLSPGDTNGKIDVFRTDRQSGITERISLDNADAQIAGDCIEPSISADGNVVVFVAPDTAVGKVMGESSQQREARRKSNHHAVYLRNMLAGTTQRMGNGMAGGVGTAPQLAPQSGAVVFTSNLPTGGGTPVPSNIYHVPLTSSVAPTPGGPVATLTPGATRCVTCKVVDANGADTGVDTNGASRNAVVSADGRYVAFETLAKNGLAAAPSPCPGSSAEVMLRDLLSGALQRMSPPPGTSNCGVAGSTAPSIDYSGTTIAFQTDQPLQASDSNGQPDIYLVSPATGVVPVRVSEAGDGTDGSGASTAPVVSGDGHSVAFVSSAPNLDLSFADNNDRSDVHTALIGDESVARLSRASSGAESDQASERPALNYDGTRLAFDSTARVLAGTSAAGPAEVYQRSNPLAPQNRSNNWWIPSESGWGLTVFDQGNVQAPTWFTYDEDGEPTWFIVAGAFPQSDGSFRGDLYRFTGTRYDQLTGAATTASTQIGNVSLRYGDDSLDFDYTALGVSQSKTLERFPFGPRSYSCTASPSASRPRATNYTDLWTGGGWGLTMFHIDTSVFAIWYTYDLDGEATFFVVTTGQQADGSFAGEVYKSRNGTPFLQINGAAATPGSDVVGTATFRFTDGDSATFGYTVSGVTRSLPIERLVIGDRPTECAAEPFVR